MKTQQLTITASVSFTLTGVPADWTCEQCEALAHELFSQVRTMDVDFQALALAMDPPAELAANQICIVECETPEGLTVFTVVTAPESEPEPDQDPEPTPEPEYSCLYYSFHTEADAIEFSKAFQELRGFPVEEPAAPTEPAAVKPRKHPTDLKQISALVKHVVSLDYSNILDYGGGVSTKAAEYAEEQGKKLYAVDPSLSQSTNRERYVSFLADAGCPSTIICANVLNVIMDYDSYCEAVTNILHIAQAAQIRTVYFTIYEGNGSGVPGDTQRNMSLSAHMKVIRSLVEPFRFEVTRSGKILIVANKKRWPRLAWDQAEP